MIGFASGLSEFLWKSQVKLDFGTGWRKFIPAVHFQPCMDYLFTWCKLSRGEIDMVTNLSGPYQKIQCCVNGHKGNFWNEVRWTTTTTLWTIRACMKCSSMAGHCFQRWRISDSNAVRIIDRCFMVQLFLNPMYLPSGEGYARRIILTVQAGKTRLFPLPNLPYVQRANWR